MRTFCGRSSTRRNSCLIIRLRVMPGPRILLPVLAVFAAALPGLRAQVTNPQPFLATISPPAARAGTTAELRVTGTDLDGASRLHFSAPGITCAPKLDDKQQPVANRFLITIPPDTAATTCDVRVVASYGISNPRGFAITPLPVIVPPITATTPEKARQVPLNTTITGTAPKQAQAFFYFNAKKGQHITVLCQPQTLDSRMDAAVTLRNAEGARLGRLRADGLLDCTTPADGAYTLEVHDLMFRGDADLPFVLTLTTGPVIQRAFDGGEQWTLYGHNLPKGKEVNSRDEEALQRLQVTKDEARRL